ncbi:hypothetical protein ACLKMY_21115 [Paraburkholderia mimosarum]|uniref:hypothetical protein n=1 Tax=Paraburkholderia mimosarum TaxID=312026 RepID=UPI0039C3AFEE
MTEDAIANRAFPPHPSLRRRWVGPARMCTSPGWRLFNGSLSTYSAEHALSILGALFYRPVKQHYVRASELIGATLWHVKTDPRVDRWLRVSRCRASHEMRSRATSPNAWE